MPQQVFVAGESVGGSYGPVDPSDDATTTLSVVPDPSRAQSFGSTKAASPLNEAQRVSSGGSKGPRRYPARRKVQAAMPYRSPHQARCSSSAQTQGDEPDPSVRDARQPAASGHKDDADATRDPAKEVDAQSGSPKATVDPPTAPQFSIQGPSQTGRAAPQIVGGPQGRSEAPNTSIPTGYQAAVRESVGLLASHSKPAVRRCKSSFAASRWARLMFEP